MPVLKTSYLDIPLWLPIVFVGIPLLLLWWRDRRSRSLSCDHDSIDRPTPLPTILCRQCRYPLDGFPDNRCPECGEVFDPSNPNTFRSAAPSKSDPVLRWAAIIAIAVFAAFVIMLHELPQQLGH
jgi:hypothetical protein